MKTKMKRVIKQIGLAWALLLAFAVSSKGQNMIYAYPMEEATGLEMLVKWDTVIGATAYAIRYNLNGAGFSAWDSLGNVNTKSYGYPGMSDKYCFQVRAFKGGAWQAPGDSICNLHGPNMWPVSTSPANCNSEAVDLLNGFGDPLDIGGVYLHSGCDINGLNGVGNECVKAPMGAIVNGMSGTYNGVNLVINLEVRKRAESRILQFNHVDSIDLAVVTGKSVERGQKVAQIDDRPAGFGWTVLSSHTHFHYYGFGSFFGTTRPPYTFFDSIKYRDPQQRRPQVMNRNGGPDSIEFGKGPDRTDYFPSDTVHNEVDIYVEAVDRQSRDIPWVNPKEAGYYIQSSENGSWVNKVQNSSKPYKLYDNKNFYNSHAGTTGTNANMTLLHILMDTLDAKHNSRWPGYSWDSHNNWCLTNTTDTSGTRATMNKDACFASDARKDEASENGWRSGYEKSKCNDDAKFPDGNYRVGIMLADYEGRAPYFYRNFQLDNYKPYIKAVVMTSGSDKIYDVKWEWQRGNDKLAFVKDNNLSGKAACDKDLVIEVETSESMKELFLAIDKIGFSDILDSSKAEAGSNYKKYKFTVPADKIAEGGNNNPLVLRFTGPDLSGNELHAWNVESDRSANLIPRRKIDGTWSAPTTSFEEKMHKFTVDTIEIEADITDATCQGSNDGEIDLTVTKGESPFTYEWSNGASSEDINGLDPGPYTVTVKDKSKCEAKETYTVGEDEPVTASISGGGAYEVRPCDPAPRIVLTASASGGRTPYSYSWGDPVKVVGSEGEYSVTVTDDRNCRDEATAYVWFIPIACSRDPNDIIGPEGFGDDKWVSTFETLPYRIRYENDPDFATAPAQIVRITHPLDSNVDIRTFRLGEFGFANFTFAVPDNTISYSKRLDLRDSMGIYVDVIAGLDVTKREAFWVFSSIDPSTGLPPDDPSKGFLPVNDTAVHDGEGYADYTIRARSDTYTGDSIRAIAEIVFDDNEEILTPRIFNLIDAVAPESEMNPLPELSDSNLFVVSWIAADDSAASGLRQYDLFVSKNNGTFELAVEGTVDTSFLYRGSAGISYRFYTIAEDNVGNREEAKNDSFVMIAVPAEGDFLKPIDTTGLCKGDSLIVQWYKTNITLIDLEISSDTGKTFEPIAKNVSVIDTVFYWIFPDSFAGNREYQVRALSSAGGVPLDTSNLFFVSPLPVVQLGNDTWFCSNVAINLTLDAGNSGARYLWSTSDTTQKLSVTGAGVFGVSVTNAYGCSSFDEISIDTFPVPQLSGTVTDNSCFGGQTGAIDLTVSSGTSPFAYQWNTSDTSQDLSGLASGSYYVIVSDSNQCTTSDTFVVSQPLAIAVSGALTNVSCAGGSNGSIDLSVSGGTSPYTFLWNTADTTEDLSGLSAGSYIVQVTDVNLCVKTDTFNVIEPSPLASAIQVRHVTCYNGNNGAVDLTVSGGIIPYEYNWSNADTSQDISSLTAGMYTVVVTDSNGCVLRDTAAVTEPTQIVLSDTLTNVSCYLGTDGRIALGVSGGSGNYTFNWSNSATTRVVTGLDSGTYMVAVTDDSGCVVYDTFSITHPDELKVTHVVLDATCYGMSNGSIDLTVIGGVTPYFYSWSNADTTQDISGLAKGTYSVIVTDNNSCVILDTVDVSEPLDLAILSSVTHPLCYGGNDGSIDISVSGGTVPYDIDWADLPNTEDRQNLVSGKYYVTVTDNNLCVLMDTLEIIDPQDISSSVSATDVTCNGAADGTIDLTVSGGTGSLSFNWTGGSTSEDLSGLDTGLYIVGIEDDNGCTLFDSANIFQPDELVITEVLIDLNCYGDSSGAIDITISGGTSPYTTEWMHGPLSEDLSNLSAGTYSLSVEDDHGCIKADTFMLSEPAELKLTKSVVDISCADSMNGSIDISISGGTQPYHYIWNTTDTTEDLEYLQEGTYNVSVLDAKGCSLTDTSFISEPSPILITSQITDVLCNGDTSGAIDISVSGGIGPYSYLWNTTETSEDLTGSKAGQYIVEVMDINGCIRTDTSVIGEPDPIILVLDSMPAHEDNSDGKAWVTVTGGVPPYSYQWDDPMNQTTDTAFNLPAGNYSVIVTDDHNCEQAGFITVNKLTGFDVLDPMNLVKVFPNPTRGTVTVYNLQQLGNDIELIVTDFSGREISREMIIGEDRIEYVFNSSSTEGVYTFTFYSGERRMYKRVILVH